MNDHKPNKSGVNPLIVGAVGAAVGAAAVVLSDKKNRDKIAESLNQASKEALKAKDQAAKKLDDMKGQAEDMKGQAMDKAEELKGQAEDMAGGEMKKEKKK